MSSQPKPTSTDALRSLAKFAFDAEEQLDDASIAQIDEMLRKQGTDPDALVNRMKQFLGQQKSELLAAEVVELCAKECSAAEERCKATGSSHASLAMWADALDEQHRADGCAICANAIRALVEED